MRRFLNDTVLSKRIITALIAIPLIAGSIQWGGQKLFFMIILIAAGAALIEFFGMAAMQSAFFKGLAFSCGLCLLWIIEHYRRYLSFESPHYQGYLFDLLMTFPALVTVAVLLVLYILYPRKSIMIRQPLVTILGVLYISLFLSYLILLYGGHAGKDWIFFILIVLWCNDSGAYLIGRMVGKHRLSPLVSPGKTVEGAVGGVVFSLIAAVFARAVLLEALSLNQALLLALVISATGQAGDLCESTLKRHFGVKDSGALLPGHGGMLDRIDSLLFAAPFTYYFKMLIA